MEKAKIINKNGKQIIDFPDPAFKNYLIRNFDCDGDGEISLEEAKHIDYIDLWHCVKKSTGPDDPPLGFSIEVESLVGIEYLENLWGLFCYDCNIKGSLNLSKNNRLEIVYCDGNEITELILGEQPELTDLYCGNNLIKEIDVSRVPRLSILHCPNNLLAALDLSCNFILEEIDCSNNRITYFDMAFCRNLVHLDATLCHPFYESKFLITKTIVRANT